MSKPVNIQRLRLNIMGMVQGVGFRPFIYRLAQEMGLQGWITNTSRGVTLEVEGPIASLRLFQVRLESDRPVHSFISSLEAMYLDPAHYSGFEIRSSTKDGPASALIVPDIATCPDCLFEIFDPANSRYLYPFTNCTNCGPRFSIIERLPYDRPNTSMKTFTMCRLCLQEYADPLDRRFHAQPNACPECGPHLELWDRSGRVLASRHQSLEQAVSALRDGQIVAVKGMGGFHFMVDATNDQAVNRLRAAKARDQKPLAVMVSDLEVARSLCSVSDLEARLLTSSEAPIVLLKKVKSEVPAPVSDSVAPANPYLGLMLPYTPLHHILMRLFRAPLVATSGNLKDETICINEQDAIHRFSAVADLFLVHNRPIVRHADDSIVRLVRDREYVLRRARGYAPLPVSAGRLLPPLIAVGADMKNTVSLALDREVFLSQHLGDLETEQTNAAFQQTIETFTRLYDLLPEAIICDRHPAYMSSRYAERSGLPVIRIQHHLAHVFSCMAENELAPPILGVAWDGTGYGDDGTIWGGEFFAVQPETIGRIAHFRTFPLPGGDQAVREPRRSALGLLYEMMGEQVFEQGIGTFLPPGTFSCEEEKTLLHMLHKSINCPLTSSVGRLFDVVSSLTGLHQKVTFEGQAAMSLEFTLPDAPLDACYPVSVHSGPSSRVIDWEPALKNILHDMKNGVPVTHIAVSFHNWLVESLLIIIKTCDIQKIVLTGGCFQNKYLIERAMMRLKREGFLPYCHQRIPCNDGGISLGQIIAATRKDCGS